MSNEPGVKRPRVDAGVARDESELRKLLQSAAKQCWGPTLSRLLPTIAESAGIHRCHQHFLLGISSEGIKHIMKEVGFPFGGSAGTYVRSTESQGAWLTEKFGEQQRGVGDENLTMWDFEFAVGAWLERQDADPSQTICQLLLARDEKDSKGRPMVKLANVFYAHQKALSPSSLFGGMLFGWEVHREQLPRADECYWWLSVFSYWTLDQLRQNGAAESTPHEDVEFQLFKQSLSSLKINTQLEANLSEAVKVRKYNSQ